MCFVDGLLQAPLAIRYCTGYRYCVSDAIYRFRVENVCALHLRTSCIVFNRELERYVTDVDKISDALISQFQNPFDLETVPSAIGQHCHWSHSFKDRGRVSDNTAGDRQTEDDAICRATACAEQHLQEFLGC